MPLFSKSFYGLNHSNTKHIVIGLEVFEKHFGAVICVFGNSRGVSLSEVQYTRLYTARDSIEKYIGQQLEKFSLDLSDERRELFVEGRFGKCGMLYLQEKDLSTGEVSSIYIAKPSLDKLFDLHGLISHRLSSINTSIPEIKSLDEQVRRGVGYTGPRARMDLNLLAHEFVQYPEGVWDAHC
jgi:hypothetical protein